MFARAAFALPWRGMSRQRRSTRQNPLIVTLLGLWLQTDGSSVAAGKIDGTTTWKRASPRSRRERAGSAPGVPGSGAGGTGGRLPRPEVEEPPCARGRPETGFPGRPRARLEARRSGARGQGKATKRESRGLASPTVCSPGWHLLQYMHLPWHVLKLSEDLHTRQPPHDISNSLAIRMR